MKCSAPTCERDVYALGLCNPHWSRQNRTGSIMADKPIQSKHYGDDAIQYRKDRRRDFIDQRQGMVDVIKLASGCIDCGYNGHPEALDFDHTEDNKEAQVADLVAMRLDRLMEEIAKCDVVCANCHRIRTARRRVGELS